MTRIEVKSSNVAAYGYDPAKRRLVVWFRHGGIYQYDAVTPNVVADLVRAESFGKALNTCVKGVFPYQRLTRVTTELAVQLTDRVSTHDQAACDSPPAGARPARAEAPVE